MISCGICGKQMANADGKWAFTTRYQNIILLVSLSLAGEIDSRQALITAESIRKAKPKMCHEHVVQAAHCMLAKMAMAGKGISYCDDPNALRSTAYVTNGDIPEDLIVVFNRMAKGSDVTITALQVSRFLNDALKRYYDTPLWPISETILMKGRRKKSEPPENPVLNTANIPSFSKTIKDEIILDGTSECSMIIEKTDPAESDYHIPVKEEIPSQSCPRCGRRLIVKQPIDVATTNVDGSICKQCSISTSPVRLWGDRVGPSGEGAYKGNVAASTAAVTTGLQYRKLERWASQLNLALFSKCFYKDISVLTKLTKRNDSWKNHTHLLPFDVKNGRTRRRRGGSQSSGSLVAENITGSVRASYAFVARVRTGTLAISKISLTALSDFHEIQAVLLGRVLAIWGFGGMVLLVGIIAHPLAVVIAVLCNKKLLLAIRSS